jgi:hypothetical protein
MPGVRVASIADVRAVRRAAVPVVIIAFVMRSPCACPRVPPECRANCRAATAMPPMAADLNVK